MKKNEGEYVPAQHTKFKILAAEIAWRQGIADKFLISGGYNFGVRYTETQILPEPDFSFEAFIRARREKSEAEIISDFLKIRGIPEETMLLEELSTTTEEQTEIMKVLLKRSTFSKMKKFALLTLLYHMKRALPIFQGVGLNVEPLFAEDLLVQDDRFWIEEICQYYSVPKGGEQWDTGKMRELFISGRSIKELMR